SRTLLGSLFATDTGVHARATDVAGINPDISRQRRTPAGRISHGPAGSRRESHAEHRAWRGCPTQRADPGAQSNRSPASIRKTALEADTTPHGEWRTAIRTLSMGTCFPSTIPKKKARQHLQSLQKFQTLV